MLAIKFGNKTVTPMPPKGMYSDVTVPNSSAQNCCLIKAAQVLRQQGVNVSAPALTKEEREAAIAAQLADKANWTDKPAAATTAEIEARRDEIRGYTEKQVLEYIEANKVYELNDDGSKKLVNGAPVLKSTPTDAQARAALIKKVQAVPGVGAAVPVTVPSNQAIAATLLTEKELATATAHVDALIASGHLVTDISGEAFTAWKAQFTMIEMESL